MNATDHEIKFYSIQFGEWCLANANKIWVDNYSTPMWLYQMKAYATKDLYDIYLKTL